jgi:streptogramin lyase
MGEESGEPLRRLEALSASTIALVLLVGFTVTLRSQAYSAAGRRDADAARQTSVPASASVSRRLRDEITALEHVLPRFLDRGAVLFLLAHDYARLGEPAKALDLLKQCVMLDKGFDPENDKAFAPLQGNPEFENLIQRVRRQNPPVRHAHLAFTVAQNDLFPEGLAVDPSTRLFYMGSEYHNKIVRISENGQVTDFVKDGMYDLMPVGGVHLDPTDHSIWCATDPGTKNRSEIVHFDGRGILLERYTPSTAGPHDLNDLVVRGRNEIYVTDTEGNHVFRFNRESHLFDELNVGRPVFEPNGITVSDDGDLLYVADDLGVIRVDLRTNQAQDVKPAAHDTMAGIDGLYWYDGGLVGVEYGTGVYRVMQWKLSPDGREVRSSETLERGTDMVRDPTTGAILDGKFYFMANTGIENLDNGKVRDPKKLEPLRIAVLPLQSEDGQSGRKQTTGIHTH